ncbi:type VI secretion system protein TssA [Paraburkholderia sp. MMS20-SJTR3]|uniref:Type VI secretion system protein TssA n=1 Tax=Paraburkholderia sejongensis TaxID=2886946 RepID=A0ABS8JRJ2_9BURK|nr:type VI secretion system protein TssA [Paraburkholderia sp. MMS20-SJTR3]MCC8392525.1 type VI secretion system protein TssA [Paraburkholderia sp. MMS20-SJTR3]
MLDVEHLLAETATMPPCGVDLEYDAEFLELDALASDKPKRQFQETDEEPPWRDIMERAAALLDRSKDLRVALIYTRAASRVAGLGGFHAGLRVLLGMHERYWENLYPALDAEDADSPAALRATALTALGDPFTPFNDHSTLLHDLRVAEVCQVPGDRLTVRDILIAAGKLDAPEGESKLTLQTVQGVLAKAVKDDPVALADALALPETVEKLANRMSACFGAEDAPSITMMMGAAQNLATVCRSVAVEHAAAAQPDEFPQPAAALATAGAAVARLGQPPATQGPARLATRADAIAMLDAVCAFLERTEPTNPAPLLIRRARALMEMDFIAIMQDLAPDSLAQIQQILGKEAK